MTANGNSPLDNMRTLEHYLSDIMRAGAADTPEHLKGTCKGFPLKSVNDVRPNRNIRLEFDKLRKAILPYAYGISFPFLRQDQRLRIRPKVSH